MKKINQKIGILVGLIMLVMIASIYSAPSISQVSGTAGNGSAIAISGSGFGTKAIATPIVWDNFESGVLGSQVRGKNPVIGPVWDVWSNGSAAHDPSYVNTVVRSGSQKSALIDFVNDGAYSRALQLNHKNYSRSYNTWWEYFDRQADYTANYKPWMVYGTNGGIMPAGYSGFGQGGTADNGIRASLQDNPMPNESWNIWGGTAIEDIEKKWVRFEVYLEQSSPNQSNGKYKVWVHIPGSTVLLTLNGDNAMTRTTSDYWTQWWILGGYHCNDSRSPNAKTYIYGDDSYFDTTLSRVELGDAATWTGCKHREIQVPSAWSDNSVTVTVNAGSFTSGQTAYLYVVDKDGNVNANGQAVVLGTPSSIRNIGMMDYNWNNGAMNGNLYDVIGKKIILTRFAVGFPLPQGEGVGVRTAFKSGIYFTIINENGKQVVKKIAVMK